MRKKLNRKKLIVVFFIYLVSIISLSVVYAALSTTLRISGSSEVVGSSWNITLKESDLWFIPDDFILPFDNFNVNGGSIAVGDGKIISKPTISGTNLNNYSVSVTKPGDAAVLYYDVINNGTIPAVLNDIVYSELSFGMANSSDIEWVQQNVIPYVGDFVAFPASPGLEIGEVLCPGQTMAIIVGIEMPSDVTSLPTDAVTISNINTTIEFVQGDLSL